VFTEEERERLRGALVSAAKTDAKLSGAAHLGSAAVSCLDAWSDIDLALCVVPGGSMADAVSAWTARMYERYDAVAHFDVRRGEILYRVFLLENTLQVDLSFWPATEFRAAGPKFKLIFGTANEPAAAPASSPANSIGMGWLYALHVRSSLERGRLLQAEYMLSGMRDEALALACMRRGVETIQGRGFDDLPEEEKSGFTACYARAMTQGELRRAFQATMRALVAEIRRQDGALAERIEPTLREVAGEPE
jgi:hypothetical protein